MRTLPKDQHKYKLTTSVDRKPLEILKKKLSETNTPLSSFINKEKYEAKMYLNRSATAGLCAGGLGFSTADEKSFQCTPSSDPPSYPG